MRPDDVIRVRHMLDAANEAEAFAAGRSRADLDTDRMLALSIVKSIEIIGEAAANVSDDGRAEHPRIPWLDIADMRNRLVHGYYDIDLDIVWDTVIDELPPLCEQLKAVLQVAGE